VCTQVSEHTLGHGGIGIQPQAILLRIQDRRHLPSQPLRDPAAHGVGGAHVQPQLGKTQRLTLLQRGADGCLPCCGITQAGQGVDIGLAITRVLLGTRRRDVLVLRQKMTDTPFHAERGEGLQGGE